MTAFPTGFVYVDISINQNSQSVIRIAAFPALPALFEKSKEDANLKGTSYAFAPAWPVI